MSGFKEKRTCDSHGIDFYSSSFWYAGHLERRSSWFVIAKKLLVDPVDGSKVVHVGQENSRLDDSAKVHAGCFKNVLDILHGASRLLLYTAMHEIHRLWIQTKLPRYVQCLMGNQVM